MQLFKRFAEQLPWFTSPKKADPKHNLVEVFKHEGHTYYRFPKETNLPLERFSMALGLMERISSGLSGGEMEQILEGMERSLAAGLSNPKNAAVVAAYIHIIRERQSNVIHRDLLLNFAAVWVVRDDEDPAMVNPDIHSAKLEVFEAMCREASHDFFSRLDIIPLLPLLSMSAEELQTLWDYNTEKRKQLKEVMSHLTTHLTTEQGKHKKTSEHKL